MEKVPCLILNWEYCWCVFILTHGVYYKREDFYSRLLQKINPEEDQVRKPRSKNWQSERSTQSSRIPETLSSGASRPLGTHTAPPGVVTK